MKRKYKKSKELLEYFKKGGREGAKKDFMELLKRASNPLKILFFNSRLPQDTLQCSWF